MIEVKIIDGKKPCSRCHKLKPISEFYSHGLTKSGFDSQCKICKNKHTREHWYTKAKSRTKNLKYTYNLTDEQYNQMYVDQNGCCAVCGTHQRELRKALGIDHNHISNQIRGLLCQTCNTALGQLKADDGIELLQNAINYLGKFYE